MKKREKKNIDSEEVLEEILEEEENKDSEEAVKAIAEITDTESETESPKSEQIDPKQSQEAEIAELYAEIETLKAELELKKNEAEGILDQIKEFALTFPKRTVESISEEVWESVRCGVPLAAAYALYEKKREASEEFTREVNQRNAERSSGAISSSASTGYYSSSEVKKMSPSEVRKNYNLIIESMKKWN